VAALAPNVAAVAPGVGGVQCQSCLHWILLVLCPERFRTERCRAVAAMAPGVAAGAPGVVGLGSLLWFDCVSFCRLSVACFVALSKAGVSSALGSDKMLSFGLSVLRFGFRIL